jgi:DNA-binding IclR family transcriptional regulator
LKKVPAPDTCRVVSWVGRRLDAHSTGLGKALIAYMPEGELEQLIAMRGLTRHNHKTVTDKERLKCELALVR